MSVSLSTQPTLSAACSADFLPKDNLMCREKVQAIFTQVTSNEFYVIINFHNVKDADSFVKTYGKEFKELRCETNANEQVFLHDQWGRIDHHAIIASLKQKFGEKEIQELITYIS